jgi:hypothetical protein
MHTRYSRWLTGAMLAALAAGAWGQVVGRIQIAGGDVQIIARDKSTRAAVRGGEVNEGDTIVTGKGSAAHIRMIDEGVIAMRADTTIVIDTYRWQGKEDGTERGVLSLLKGGFRTITGVIGRTNKSQYLVNTPTATIGIRGTDHEPFYIAVPAPGETPPGDPGTYNKVNVGETFIRSPDGTIELAANQVGFASARPGVAPARLGRTPGFMRGAPLPRGKPDLRGVREFARRDPQGDDFVRAARARDASPPTLRQLAAFLIRTAGEEFDLGGQSGAFRDAPVGSAVMGGLFFNDDGQARFTTAGTAVSGANNSRILLNEANEPLIISNASDFLYARQGATQIDAGGAVVDDSAVKWGVYTGGVRFDNRGASPVLLTTFMLVSRITTAAELAVPGTQTYGTTVGFTRPVDESRRIGGTAALTASVTFGAMPLLTSYNLVVTDPSARTWTGTLNRPSQTLSSFFGNQSAPNLAVTCAGACASTGVGDASGFVIGSNRGGLVSSYGMAAGTAQVTGSIVVRP